MTVQVSIRNVKKSFGENIIHRGISFDLFQGETLGLLGNSGTGKSVLLRSLIGLEKIDNGEIYYKNQRIDNLSEDQLINVRKQISYAFQSGALFDSINVFENIAYPLIEHTKLNHSEIELKVRDVLKLVDMADKELLMPSELSGGMQKRVGLARSIVLGPSVILYDEPTAGLDPVNVKNILQVIKKLKEREISSIFVTHDIPAAVEICDRIIIIDKGVVAYQGKPEELRNSSEPIVKAFFTGMQLENN